MTKSEKKIAAFCVRHRLSYEWQQLRYDGIRAFVNTVDRYHHAAMLDAARRLKGIRVTERICNGGGVWEGRIYFQDAADAERVDRLCKAESERNNAWCQVYHDCIVAGMDRAEASKRDESLYPTPA